MDKIEELLTRGVANIIPGKDKFQELLSSGKKLNVYLGIDPTAIQIHLGHAVALRKLNQFAQLGHNVTFLIGDFTALVGDTSDKDTERPLLTSEQIERNLQTYKEQASKVLDFSKVQIKFNSEWLKQLDFKDILQLCYQFSLNDFLSRELIRKRLDSGSRVGLHEVLYPIMQGYDSFVLDTDVQVGGTDQTFNMQTGRVLLKNRRNKESFILATQFLMGTDGRKMSKSWGNAIWLNDSPNDMYVKVMGITDHVIIDYFMLGTQMSLEEIRGFERRLEEGENPIVIKKELAHEIVSELYSEEEADQAEENFHQTAQKHERPAEIPTFKLSDMPALNARVSAENATITDAFVYSGLASSRAEAKRTFEQKGGTVNGKLVVDPNAPFAVSNEVILGKGKHRFVKITK